MPDFVDPIALGYPSTTPESIEHMLMLKRFLSFGEHASYMGCMKRISAGIDCKDFEHMGGPVTIFFRSSAWNIESRRDEVTEMLTRYEANGYIKLGERMLQRDHEDRYQLTEFPLQGAVRACNLHSTIALIDLGALAETDFLPILDRHVRSIESLSGPSYLPDFVDSLRAGKMTRSDAFLAYAGLNFLPDEMPRIVESMMLRSLVEAQKTQKTEKSKDGAEPSGAQVTDSPASDPSPGSTTQPPRPRRRSMGPL